MPWTYSHTGRLSRNGQDVATGCSGRGIGRNDASMAAILTRAAP